MSAFMPWTRRGVNLPTFASDTTATLARKLAAAWVARFVSSGRIIREAAGWEPPKWVPASPAWLYQEAKQMHPAAADCGAWFKELLRGCMTGTREEGSMADVLLRDSQGGHGNETANAKAEE